jgi:hypothetical protein
VAGFFAPIAFTLYRKTERDPLRLKANRVRVDECRECAVFLLDVVVWHGVSPL